MALAGSQKAYKQARSGIARSGATRSGYYLGDAVVTIDIDGVPTDVSRYVVHNGWSITLNLNDEIDTAAIAFLPTLPYVLTTRSVVRLGLGSAGNVQFAGLILTIQRSRRPGPDARLWTDVTCVDWTTLLDAHLVVADYPAQSATTTILDLVARFTRAQISTAGVPANLPSVAGFTAINERPSTILRRVTNKIGGGFWLDANRVLRAWSSTIPSPIQESTPAPLTDTLPTLKQFRMTTDASQQRTRVFVEGKRTATLLGVPALPLTQGAEVPVTEGQIVANAQKVRVGLQVGNSTTVHSPVLDTSRNPPGSVLTPSNAIVGSTILTVENTAPFRPQGGWAQVASQVVRYSVLDATRLQIPAAGLYGALQAPVSVGAQIIDLPWFIFGAEDRPVADINPAVPWVAVATKAQPEDTPVVLFIREHDATAAAALAQREGSDGYYEHLVQDGRYTVEGATARAQAELADFAQPTVAYEWETEDLNAEPGRMQHLDLSSGPATARIVADVRITNVTITPIATNHPPRRQVRATMVRAAGVVDTWVDDPR